MTDDLVPAKAAVLRLRFTDDGELLWGLPGTWRSVALLNVGPLMRANQTRAGGQIMFEVCTPSAELGSKIHRVEGLRRSVTVEIGSRTFPTTVDPMLQAAIDGRWDDVEEHLALGSDPARRDPIGNTTLHYAAASGDLALVRRIVASGTPIGWRNGGEQDAEDVARERDHHDVSTWLALRRDGGPAHTGSTRTPIADRGAYGFLGRFLSFTGVAIVVLLPVAWSRPGFLLAAAPLGLAATAVRGWWSQRGSWAIRSWDGDCCVLRDRRRTRTVRISDIAAVAITGPWHTGPARLALGLRTAGHGAPAIPLGPFSATDRRRVLAASGEVLLLRWLPLGLRPLEPILRPLLDRSAAGGQGSEDPEPVEDVEIGRVIDRYVAWRRWTPLRTCARPLRRHRRWHLDVVPEPDADGGSPPVPWGVSVLPTGFVSVHAYEAGNEVVTWWTSVEAVVSIARRRVDADVGLQVAYDHTFPWVASVVDRLRSTGVQILRAPSADLGDAPPPGNALIHHIKTGRSDLALDLAASGWDLEAGDDWGRVALSYAVAIGDAELVRSLVALGADPDAPDDVGRTPATLASATYGPEHAVAVALRESDGR